MGADTYAPRCGAIDDLRHERGLAVDRLTLEDALALATECFRRGDLANGEAYAALAAAMLGQRWSDLA